MALDTVEFAEESSIVLVGGHEGWGSQVRSRAVVCMNWWGRGEGGRLGGGREGGVDEGRDEVVTHAAHHCLPPSPRHPSLVFRYLSNIAKTSFFLVRIKNLSVNEFVISAFCGL